MDAQADLSLRWALSHCVGFVMSRLIFLSFGIIELMLVCFEDTVLLKPALEGVRDVVFFSVSPEQTQ